MTPELTRRLTLLFLAGFVIDGVVRLAATFLPILLIPQLLISWPLFMFGFGLWFGIVVSPRFPKRFLVPTIGFLAWANLCGGVPLWFYLGDGATPLLGGIQVILGIVVLTLALLRWPDRSATPVFSWPNFAVSTLASIFLVPGIAAISLANAAATGIEARTNGFAKLRPSGLYCEERRFERDGKEIHLVAMIHIASDEFYGDIAASLISNDDAVVLLEGVSDQRQLLTNGFSYAAVAELIGATPQENSLFSSDSEGDDETPNDGGVAFHRADVDVSAFHPDTITTLNLLGAFLADPLNPDRLRALSDQNSPASRSGAQELLFADIVDKRNDHLTTEIQTALTRYNIIIVPWGALHLPDIESTLLEWGFHEISRTPRPAFQFWK